MSARETAPIFSLEDESVIAHSISEVLIKATPEADFIVPEDVIISDAISTQENALLLRITTPLPEFFDVASAPLCTALPLALFIAGSFARGSDAT